ncbi:hypothetical protein C0993_005139 [Termitomyces sp. T159_Od127]|nr:hypothetical protein C0993_005139 [Termitomyces sp. T159_Od127]
MREDASQAQYEMGTKVLLQHLEAAEQPVPPSALFLQDNLAVMVMEGLLNQIELMQKQHVLALEQIDRTTKCKLLSPEETVSKPKQAQQQLPQPVDVARAGVLTTSKVVPQVAPPMDRPARPTAASTGPVLPVGMPVQPTAAPTGQSTSVNMLAWPVAASTEQSAVVTSAPVALMVPKVLGVQKAMDKEMGVVEVGGAANAAQMLFMKAVVFPAPPEQVAVVVVPTDPRTPVQYDGIVAIAAAKKGKHCEALPINNNSNYGESQSEEEEEEEEGKTLVQCFQRIQWNKKITKKKVNKAEATAALAH